MKRFSFLFLGLALAASAAFGQTGTPANTTPAGTGKIGLVNINMFADEKGGITRFRNALTAFNNEIKPAVDELNAMETRRQNLGKEIQTMQQQLTAAGTGSTTVPINRSNYDAKVLEFQKLETDMKRKDEDLKALQERRYPAVVGPVFAEILKAMNEYAKQKGFAVILDGARLEQAEILLGFDDKYDITKDFIAYFNARPPGTASNTQPR